MDLDIILNGNSLSNLAAQIRIRLGEERTTTSAQPSSPKIVQPTIPSAPVPDFQV
jgi:hypothetical protein